MRREGFGGIARSRPRCVGSLLALALKKPFGDEFQLNVPDPIVVENCFISRSVCWRSRCSRPTCQMPKPVRPALAADFRWSRKSKGLCKGDISIESAMETFLNSLDTC